MASLPQDKVSASYHILPFSLATSGATGCLLDPPRCHITFAVYAAFLRPLLCRSLWSELHPLSGSTKNSLLLPGGLASFHCERWRGGCLTHGFRSLWA